MTDEQWRATWVLSELAGDLDGEQQREFLAGATTDGAVGSEVIALFEELGAQPQQAAEPDRRAGDVVGRYILSRRIGVGGMGEVYAAEDSELRRFVALKFLPRGVAEDGLVISEARLASRLNHPNIVTVYELIHTPWGLAMCMELVDGQSLRNLLKTSQLSRLRLIRIARQLASALAAAHEEGIVHRDIKPENVMVRENGFVKLLDFGLAENIRHGSPGRAAALPVGTLRYMSPEQKAGRPATTASDIYSLGVVLDEAQSWKHPILTRMLSDQPDRRPAAREVEQVLAQLETAETEPASAPKKRLGVASATATGVLAVCLAGAFWLALHEQHAPTVPPSAPFEIAPVAGMSGSERMPSIAPDGHKVVFAFTSAGSPVSHLYLKDMDAAASPLQLTQDKLPDTQPMFSPDQTKIAFVRGRRGNLHIMLLPLSSGKETQVTELSDVFLDRQELTWTPDGKTLIFSDLIQRDAPQVALFALPEAGGTRRQLTFPAGQEVDCMPHVSPDGNTLGFARLQTNSLGHLVVMPLAAALAASRNTPLQPLPGEPEVILSWSWTADGRGIFKSCAPGFRTTFWRQALGGANALRVAGLDDQIAEFSLSRAGDRMVYAPVTRPHLSVWRYPMRAPRSATGTAGLEPSAGTPFLSSDQADVDVRYSPDGAKIAFSSLRTGRMRIWVCPEDGSNPVLIPWGPSGSYNNVASPSWSPDGRWIAADAGEMDGSKIYILDTLGGKPRRLSDAGRWNDMVPSWSPDGRWIYYRSERAGSWNIWKGPVSGGKHVQVTHHGGFESAASPDGQWLYYTKSDRGPGMWRVSLQSGEESAVPSLAEVNSRSWDRSSTGIYYVSAGTPTVLEFFDFETQRLHPVRTMPAPPIPFFRGLAIPPDQQSLLYVQAEPGRSNLILVKNFH